VSITDSRLRDSNQAAESAMLTRNLIQRQQTASILAQANVAPQLVLNLLS
jgi:flagellin-like hook-associated protein FlgL